MCFRPANTAKQVNECPKCYKENPPEAKVCTHCGAMLGVKKPQAAAPKAPGSMIPGQPPKPPVPPKPGVPMPPGQPPMPSSSPDATPSEKTEE